MTCVWVEGKGERREEKRIGRVEWQVATMANAEIREGDYGEEANLKPRGREREREMHRGNG